MSNKVMNHEAPDDMGFHRYKCGQKSNKYCNNQV